MTALLEYFDLYTKSNQFSSHSVQFKTRVQGGKTRVQGGKVPLGSPSDPPMLYMLTIHIYYLVMCVNLKYIFCYEIGTNGKSIYWNKPMVFMPLSTSNDLHVLISLTKTQRYLMALHNYSFNHL